MAVLSLPKYSGVQQADTSASANSVVLRDNQGGAAFVQALASELKSSGALTLAVSSISATQTIDGTSTIWLVDATAGAIVINLPAAAGVTGRMYIVKKVGTGSNNVTITPAGGELIDGAATKVISTANVFSVFVSNGTNWFIVG